MKTLVLISGSLRTFRNHIHRLREYDLAVYVSKDDEDTYLNHESLRFLSDEPSIKTLIIEQLPTIPIEYRDTRHQNTYKQWYKLQRLWQCVPKTYDVYVRLRPDICITDIDDFEKAIQSCDGLSIPIGNDRDGLNDQFAIGIQDAMDDYCNTITTLRRYPEHTSEYILARHLDGVSVNRITIPYKLVLSTAKVIAIAGDSGSGKSYISSLIRPLFLFDKVLEFETDRYHKWERGDEHWKNVTHLHPDANYLEKLEDDTFHLKIGDAILAVDYDHTTGRFTPPQSIEPKDNILVCGLHTLYSKQLRNLSDLKIYVDTSDELKTEWKVRRDTEERGHSKDTVLKRIESRRIDYERHIQPQRDHADLVVQFHGTSLTLESRYREWFAGLPGEHEPNKITFHDPNIDVRKQIYEFLWGMDLPHINAHIGYEGVLQFTILRALYSKHG